MLFAYPESALANRNVAKSRIYQHQTVKTDIKNLFTTQVEKITWLYKLSDSTLNVTASEQLPELQVFQIQLKQDSLDERVLRAIDAAIPSPIIFEVHTADEVQTVAAFKPFGKTQKSQLSRYFASPWFPKNAQRQPLPFANSIEALYGKLLNPLLPYPAKENESIARHIERIGRIEKLERAIKRCESRLRKEKQLNKQAPINRELRALKEELSELI